MLNRFLRLESITLNSILRHYTQISLTKLSELLKIPTEELKQQLNQYNSVKSGQNPWDLTIMNPLLSQRKIINIEITEDGIVRLYEFEKNEENLGEDEWKQYREEVGWLSEKVEAL